MDEEAKLKNIYELLDEVRKRPGLYLNNTQHSLSNLLAFISGLTCGGWGAKNPPFGLFPNWLGVRVIDMERTNLPYLSMQEKWGDEKAFQMFFELLDEYRSCKSVCRYRAVIRDQKPNFYNVSNIDERVEPEKPLEICVAQFAPFEVYYLWEVYFDRHEVNRPSFRHSVWEVREFSEPHWGVSKDEWLEVA